MSLRCATRASFSTTRSVEGALVLLSSPFLLCCFSFFDSPFFVPQLPGHVIASCLARLNPPSPSSPPDQVCRWCLQHAQGPGQPPVQQPAGAHQPPHGGQARLSGGADQALPAHQVELLAEASRPLTGCSLSPIRLVLTTGGQAHFSSFLTCAEHSARARARLSFGGSPLRLQEGSLARTLAQSPMAGLLLRLRLLP